MRQYLTDVTITACRPVAFSATSAGFVDPSIKAYRVDLSVGSPAGRQVEHKGFHWVLASISTIALQCHKGTTTPENKGDGVPASHSFSPILLRSAWATIRDALSTSRR
jgi:hypothetical protein